MVVVALRSTLLRSPGLGEAAHRLWKHSLLAASATQEIASELPPWETAGFLAGLLHDLGQLVVLGFVAELPAWQEDGSDPSAETVDKILDATHAPLGAMVLASWGFPEAFCEAVLTHHDSSQATENTISLAGAMELGHRIANQIEEGWPSDCGDLPEFLISLGARAGLDVDRLADVAAEAEANLEALTKLS